jgi:hypothetical protein
MLIKEGKTLRVRGRNWVSRIEWEDNLIEKKEYL